MQWTDLWLSDRNPLALSHCRLQSVQTQSSWNEGGTVPLRKALATLPKTDTANLPINLLKGTCNHFPGWLCVSEGKQQTFGGLLVLAPS